MLKIGITGGIGSGKTTVCKIFELLSIPVYYADMRAKELMVQNKTLIQNIIYLLGDESYTKDLQLNKKYIADKIFNDKEKLKGINALVHPVVKRDFKKWTEKQNSSYIIQENALLFDTGQYKELDYNILVSAPPEIRIFRVMQRDNTDFNSILARINNQMDEKYKTALADYFIINDGKHSLIKQIIELDKELTSIHLRDFKRKILN